MNQPYENLLSALHGIPHLPDAACTGRWELMDDVELPDDAMKVCASCSALKACDAWARAQPVNSLHGVVGGRVYQWVSHPSQRRQAKTA